MIIRRIALSGFRNYDEETVEFSPGVNVITGENAQGKTNLLEAIYLLTGSHSFRTRTDRELIKFDCDWAKLLADIEQGGCTQTVQMVLRKGQKKQVTVNSAKKTQAELSGVLKAVLFSPEDLYLVKEGPQIRRRLMDRTIGQLRPTYASLVSEYNRLLESKTNILKQWREREDLLDSLDVYSESMARCSARIIRYRDSYVKRLNTAAAAIHADFSEGAEKLRLQYKTVSTVTDPSASADAILGEVLAHQRAHRQAELEAGTCLTGIHKDDIEIFINGASARSFASQGQTRTAALSMKLAEREIFLEETGEYPVLLLDDVLSELDIRRQSFVLNRIGGGQTLITCCEDENIASRTGGTILSVHDGRIR